MNSRKLLAILTATIMMVSVMATAAVAFTDVPAGHPASGAFDLLKDLKVYRGYPDGKAGPDNPITRAEFCAVVVRMLGRDKLAESMNAYTPGFPDPIPAWAWGYVNVATSLEIIRGYPDGTFRADDPVTFAEAFAMLARALRLDKAAFGPWPFNYLILANEVGLDAGLDPVAGLPINRGEMAIATRNAMIAPFAWDAKEAELITGLPLLRRAPWSWDADKFNTMMGAFLGTFTGQVTLVRPQSRLVTIGGKEYTYNTAMTFWLNGAKQEAAPYDAAGTGLDQLRVDKRDLTVALDGQGRVNRVSWTVTKEDLLVTAATVAAGETAFGTITVDNVAVNVSPAAPAILLNGKSATVAEVRAALLALRAAYTADANAVALVRTQGNDAIGANNVLWLDIRTDTIVAGTVTVLGNDAGGAFFRITVAGESQKIYYTGITPAVGANRSFLIGQSGKALVALAAPAAPVASDVFWARVTGVESSVANFVHTLFTHRGDFLGKSAGTPAVFDQTAIAGAALNKVAAVKLTDTGRVDVLWTTGAYDSSTFAVTGKGRLHYGVQAESIGLVAGLTAIEIKTQGGYTNDDIANAVVLATAEVLILRSTGAPSARDLAHLRANKGKIETVFYLLKDGVRTAQIIQLNVNE